jgi:hypothetical protein
MLRCMKKRLRWNSLSLRVDATGRAYVQVIGCLGHTLAEASYDPYDYQSIRASARWLRVPFAQLYDATLQVRRGRPVRAGWR